MKGNIFRFSAVILLTLVLAGKALAQKDQIEKVWYNQEKTSKIQIYLAKDGGLYGRIVWLKEPNDKDTGKPRTDKENPEESQRSAPLQGLVILRFFKPDPSNPNLYTGGTVYDPKNGKTYCGKLTFKGNSIDLRGYICNLPFLGRTSTWTLAEGQ